MVDEASVQKDRDSELNFIRFHGNMMGEVYWFLLKNSKTECHKDGVVFINMFIAALGDGL